MYKFLSAVQFVVILLFIFDKYFEANHPEIFARIKPIHRVRQISSLPQSTLVEEASLKEVATPSAKPLTEQEQLSALYDEVGIKIEDIENIKSKQVVEAIIEKIESYPIEKKNLIAEAFLDMKDCLYFEINGPCTVSKSQYQSDTETKVTTVIVDGKQSSLQIVKNDGSSLSVEYFANGEYHLIQDDRGEDDSFIVFNQDGTLKERNDFKNGVHFKQRFENGKLKDGHVSKQVRNPVTRVIPFPEFL